MEISAETTKWMTNIANGAHREIKAKGQQLGTVPSSKYMETIISDYGTKPEIISGSAQATTAHTKLRPVSLESNLKLVRSLVICHFHIFVCLGMMHVDSRTRGGNAGF